MGADDTVNQNQPVNAPVPPQQPSDASAQHGILDKTLGEVLQSNPQAQHLVMKSMGISQEKFQEMLGSAQQNNLMHMKIRDLFKNGIVQQAVQQQGQANQQQVQGVPVQLTPEQMKQLQEGKMSLQDVQSLQQQQPQNPQTQTQKSSFLDTVKGWFK